MNVYHSKYGSLGDIIANHTQSDSVIFKKIIIILL